MNYLPARLVRPAKLSEVAGPAIVLPNPGREEAFLVTGGEQPYVCFVTGSYIGNGFPKEKAARWSGLAIEGVGFELDVTSAFRPAFIDQPLGALIRAKDELLMYVGTPSGHGFEEAIRVEVQTGFPSSSTEAEVGFTKWRATVGEGASRLVVFEFDAAKKANV
jgi:hypothetical protein